MKAKKFFLTAALTAALMSLALMVLAAPMAIAQIVQGGAIPEGANGPEVQWLWGEVVSVDPAQNAFVVKYLDYETDQEKEITIAVDEKTAFENIRSLDEIKPQDTLSVDYIVVAAGTHIAKNISVEKPEEAITVPQEPLLPSGQKKE
jgi:hypothetical protein